MAEPTWEEVGKGAWDVAYIQKRAGEDHEVDHIAIDNDWHTTPSWSVQAWPKRSAQQVQTWLPGWREVVGWTNTFKRVILKKMLKK